MATAPTQPARVVRALRSVLPAGTPIEVATGDAGLIEVTIGTERVTVVWIGEGWLGDATRALASVAERPLVVVARRMSPGARAALAHAVVGWVDESGAAEIALPRVVISRSGRPDPKVKRAPRWTASTIGTAEALLMGTRPTVAAVHQATGLSTGASTNALASLMSLGLLQSNAARGRGSARVIVDRELLLRSYADAAIARTPRLSLRVGVVGRDLLDDVAHLGERWDAKGVAWALSGIAGASTLAPYLSEVAGLDVLVDAATPAELDALAAAFDLPPMDGGRLVLRPFPTAVTQRLSGSASGLCVAPWPRVYADLRILGVRGEEAAEHLLEVVGGG